MKSPSITIESFGELFYHDTPNDNNWFGRVKNISPDNEVELTINVSYRDQDLGAKIDLIKGFANDYFEIMTILFNYIDSKTFDKSLSEIEDMYFLTAVTLHNDNETWWVVLEPAFEVESIHNHFQRFTLKNREIIWANF